MGKHGTGALVTLAERKSRMYLVKRVDAKRAVDVRDAVIALYGSGAYDYGGQWLRVC